MSAGPTGSRRRARPSGAGTPRAGCSARGDSCRDGHRIRDQRCGLVLGSMPHEIAVAVPDRERVAALLGVLDTAKLAPDVHIAVERDLTPADPNEALLFLRVLARVDDERPGHTGQGRRVPKYALRMLAVR